MKNAFIFALFILCAGAQAHELRLWEDVNGNQYKAVYVRDIFDKVTLRDESGKDHTLAVEDFSDLDKKYLRVMVPPNMEISFEKQETDKEPRVTNAATIFEVTKIISTRVTVKKDGRRPFTSRLYAEIFLFAKEVDRGDHILLHKTDTSFLFTDSNDYTAVLKCPPVQTRTYQEFNDLQIRGEKYDGYMVVISDHQKNIIKIKTDMADLWFTDPDVINNLRDLYLRGKASIRSRHFDETGRKREVSRPHIAPPATR